MDLTTSSKNSKSSSKFDKDVFSAIDKTLTSFSKRHRAWTVVFEVLKNPTELSDTEIFQASSILKNKMTYDFPAFRQQINEDNSVVLQMRSELVQILQHYASNNFRAGSICH